MFTILMKVLELFSGSHSVGKVCKELGYDVVSVDITDYDGKYTPTHKVDIMEFDYKQYDHFDIIWASPPCVKYSSLQPTLYGKKLKRLNGEVFTKEIHELEMKQSDIIVNKALEIIDYFKPKLWFIENPANSQLRKRVMMKDKTSYVVSYCKYSDWGYRKNTRIWTNKTDFVPKVCKYDCDNRIGKSRRHLYIMGSKKNKVATKGSEDDKYLQRAKIPPKLITELLT